MSKPRRPRPALPELVYTPRPREVRGHRPSLTLEELLAVSLRRLPSAINHEATVKQRRPEETVFVCFDGHSMVGQHAFRVAGVLDPDGVVDGDVDAQLAASEKAGEPWTWGMAGLPEEIAVTLHQDIGGAPEELCKVIWGWQWYESPPETVRVVLTTDSGSEIRWLAIERYGSRVAAVHPRPKGSPTVGPPSRQTVRMGKMDLYREIQALNPPPWNDDTPARGKPRG
jgi:hypothetical protein